MNLQTLKRRMFLGLALLVFVALFAGGIFQLVISGDVFDFLKITLVATVMGGAIYAVSWIPGMGDQLRFLQPTR